MPTGEEEYGWWLGGGRSKLAGGRGAKQARLVALFRRAGLVLLAAVVLLPPYILGALAVGGVVVYICMAAARSISRRQGM